MGMQRSSSCVALLLVFMLAGATAQAQAFVDTPDGRAEVIGLRRWTAKMLADSLQLRAPGVSLFQTTECTKTMTERLHFSSVYIERMFFTGQSTERAAAVVVRLVEPADSARIHWLREPRDSEPIRAEWADLRRTMSDSAGRFVERFITSLGVYGYVLRDGAPAAIRMVRFTGSDSVEALAFWESLNHRRADSDRRLAIRTLRQDGNRRNRMMAAAVLANFPSSDETWHALAEALRDPYPGVNTAAMMSLSLLGRGFARPVEWAAIVPSLRTSLEGTNLQAFLPLVTVLAQTSISPQLARPLLAGGGELLVAHAEAADVRSHTAAIALLERLRGQPSSDTKWRAWVASL
jgi:hypothetical protein